MTPAYEARQEGSSLPRRPPFENPVLHTVSVVNVGPGVVNVIFIEDISDVPFGPGWLTNTTTDTPCDSAEILSAHEVQCVGDFSSFGAPGDAYAWTIPIDWQIEPGVGIFS